MQLSDLSPQQLRKAADIKERIDALQAELNELLGAAEGSEAPSKPRVAGSQRRKAHPSLKGDAKLTIQAAVLEALGSGEAMSKREIAKRVSVLRGKKTNPDSLNPTLDEMKREDRTILNPERGMYQIRAQ